MKRYKMKVLTDDMVEGVKDKTNIGIRGTVTMGMCPDPDGQWINRDELISMLTHKHEKDNEEKKEDGVDPSKYK